MEAFLSGLGSQILQLVLTAVLVAAGGWLVAQAKLNWAKAKEYAPQLCDALEEAANLAVKAAEQSKLGKLIEDKKTYALTVAETYLAAKGFNVDLHLIEAAIERAVLENFGKDETKKIGFQQP